MEYHRPLCQRSTVLDGPSCELEQEKSYETTVAKPLSIAFFNYKNRPPVQQHILRTQGHKRYY